MLCILVTKIRWPKDVFGLGGNILKIKLVNLVLAIMMRPLSDHVYHAGMVSKTLT